MADDFFGEIGNKFSNATQNVANATTSFFSSTKLNSQIAGEKKDIEKLFYKLGEATYGKVKEGVASVDGDLAVIVEEIRAHEEAIAALKDDLAKVRNKKICPECGFEMDRKTPFCPQCGTKQEIPVDEPEEAEAAEGDGEIEIEEAVSLEEVAEDAAEDAGEAFKEAAEKAVAEEEDLAKKVDEFIDSIPAARDVKDGE